MNEYELFYNENAKFIHGGIKMNEKNGNMSLITMLVFIIMNFILSMSGTLFNGILDKIAVDMNISVAQTGYLTSLYAYGAIGAPIILILLRKMSQSRLLKGMLFLNIIFGVLSIMTKNFLILLMARFMLGLVGTTYSVLATTTIASISSHDKVGRNLSLLITGSAVALMIGIPLCRVLINHYSWQSIYFVLILFMAMGLIYFAIYLPHLKQENTSLNIKAELSLFKNKNVMIVVLSSLITFIGYGGFYTYITPYIVEVFPSLEAVMSILLVFIGACSFLGNLLGGVVCDQIGFDRALWIGSICQVVIGFIILLTQDMMYINILFVLLWMMNGWFIGLQLNTGINIVTHHQSRLLVSINGSIIQFAQALGASIASIIISGLGISWNIALSIVTSLLIIVIFMTMKKEDN